MFYVKSGDFHHCKHHRQINDKINYLKYRMAMNQLKVDIRLVRLLTMKQHHSYFHFLREVLFRFQNRWCFSEKSKKYDAVSWSRASPVKSLHYYGLSLLIIIQ